MSNIKGLASVLMKAHAYADAKYIRYGLPTVKDPPDPQEAFETLEQAIIGLVEAERENIKNLYRKS